MIGALFVVAAGPAYCLEVGEKAPIFALPDLQDRTHSLTDYQGKVVLVNFWASWCKECLLEMPSLNALYKRYSGQGLMVLGVTVDRKPDDAAAAARKTEVVFPILLDRKGEVFMKEYAVIGLPTTILVDRNGLIRETFVGMHDFLDASVSDKVQSVLKEKIRH